MDKITEDDRRTAKYELEKAFRQLRQQHSLYPYVNGSIYWGGLHGIKNTIDDTSSQMRDFILFAEREEKDCDSYLRKHCPAFYEAVKTSRTSDWDDCSCPPKEKERARERINKATENIGEYAKKRGREFAESLEGGLKRRLDNLMQYGLGRPWGNEIRRHIAVAFDLQKEVNNLWELGLNSVANSKSVYLGETYIKQIKNDPGMSPVISTLEMQIKKDILSKVHDTLEVTKIEGVNITGSKSVELGGKRSPANMMEQLKFTLKHPINSQAKYADTWNVAMNELTWILRHCSVYFTGVYHALYNIAGFGFIWEMEFSIEDILDLRPHSKNKIDFGGGNESQKAYNIVTSILGTTYHDILGNTDKLKVRAKWTDTGIYKDGIVPWAGLYYR